MRLAGHIAKAINENRDCGAYGSVVAQEIARVKFRRGCAEIEVVLKGVGGDEVHVVDAAPVLTHMLMAMMQGGL